MLGTHTCSCSAGQPNDKSVLHDVLGVEDVVDLVFF